jgi:hypothetical protein
VQTLLRRGVEVDARDQKGQFALFWAASCREPSLVPEALAKARLLSTTEQTAT